MTRNQRDFIVLDIIVPVAVLIGFVLVALMLASVVAPTPAKAHCPPGTAYGCVYDPVTGKQVCGCR